MNPFSVYVTLVSLISCNVHPGLLSIWIKIIRLNILNAMYLVNGIWKEWQAWLECSVTCGGGQRLRHRDCEGPYYGGAECEGPAEDSEVCGTADCPSKTHFIILSDRERKAQVKVLKVFFYIL